MHTLTLKLIFSNKKYLVLAASIFSGFLFLLSLVSEYIFLQPSFIFYVPYDDFLNFSLIVMVSALSGLVISMSVYKFTLMSGFRKSSSGFFGSIIGASAGACSCGPIGFSIISTFGVVGGTATAFLTTYEIPLRLVSIGILIYTYFYTIKALTAECKIK